MQPDSTTSKSFASQLYDWGKVAIRTRLAITIWRILLLYIALQICRVTFYIYNEDLIGSIEGEEVWSLFKGSLLFDGASIAFSTSLFLILTSLPVSESIWNSKFYRITTFVTYILPVAIMLVANLGDAVYFHYTQGRCTAEEIFYANNDNTTQLAGQFIMENWYLVLLFVLILVGIIYSYRLGFKAKDIVPLTPHKEDRENINKRPNGHKIRGIVLFVVVRIIVLSLTMLFAVYSIRGGITRMTRPITLSNAMLYTLSPNKANLILSNPFCIIRTISVQTDTPQYFEQEVVDAIYSPSHHAEEMTKSELYGCCEGHNVVLFILESFSAEHSAYLMPDIHTNGGYTPHLDKIMSEGLTLERCYANGHTSIEAPPAIWSSIPSYQSRFILMAESIAEYKALPTILKDKGYHTAFFCGSEHGSMGFSAFAHLVDIENLYSMEDYYARHGKCNFDGAWGIWDEPFIDFMGEELCSFEEPFFASIITLSSHHPFNVPDDAAKELPEGTTLNHRPVAYTDRAIGRFMEKYKDEEWFKNTLFIFVADHVSSERMAPRTYSTPECFHIVGAMYTPDGSLPAQHYNSITSQVDIMPTALGLLGNEEPYFAIGRDIFNEPHRESFTLIRSGYGHIGITNDFVVDFNGTTSVGAYSHLDYSHSHDISSQVNIDHVDSLIKAHLQQYYHRVNHRDYLPTKR